MTTTKTTTEILNYIIDDLNNGYTDTYGCDLHTELFNTDYYIIGAYAAEQWLQANGGVFNAIETIKQYEQDQFGEVNTDFSDAEKVVNMYTYILGEECLNESKTLQEVWNERLTDENIEAIKEELKEMVSREKVTPGD